MIALLLAATTALRVVTLEGAIETALRQHPDLRAADAQVEQARARADVARAPLLPQLDLSARYTASAGSRPGEGFRSYDDGHSYSAGLDASLLLWDFGRTRDRWRAARASAEAQGHDEEVTRRDVRLAVELAFFDALAARRLTAIAKESQASEERHLAEIEKFVKVGTRPEIDLVRARTALATARGGLIRAENDEAAARARLAGAMGVTSSAFTLADAVPGQLGDEDRGTAQLVDEAVARRPELAALAASRDAQVLTVRASERGNWPSLNLGAGVSTGGVRFDGPGWDASVGVVLSWPIFNGLATRATARAERMSLVVLDAQTEALRQRVWLELDEARLAVRSAKADQVAAVEAAAAARELLHLAERRYQEGLGHVIELSDAQLANTTAAANEVRVTYTLAGARARLRWALGM